MRAGVTVRKALIQLKSKGQPTKTTALFARQTQTLEDSRRHRRGRTASRGYERMMFANWSRTRAQSEVAVENESHELLEQDLQPVSVFLRETVHFAMRSNQICARRRNA